MDSDFDRSSIVTPDLTPDSKSFLSRSNSYKHHHSLPWMENHHKAYLIPVEIYSEIFQYTVQADPRSQWMLMAVCHRWYDIMLSTPGIRSQLHINTWTEKKDVERFGRRWLLDVTVDMQKSGYIDPRNFDPERFFVSFMAAAQAAPRWRSLRLVSFPPHGEYKDLQIVQPLQHLETFKLGPSCNLGNFLEPLMTTIATTVTPRLTVMEVLHPDAVPYLFQPAHFQIFSSLTTLRLICRKMQNPADILPYLHKLEIFEAHHLFLPIYSPSIHLPMIQTLHVLHLKSVSVQWMAGQIFPALEECSIVFPHHADAIHHSIYIPSCSILKYESNNLGALEHFQLPILARLEVKCGQWRTWSGSLQLAALHSIFASQSLTCLHLQIKCSETLLVHMLELVPDLEELWMGLSSPHALSSAFFLAIAAGGCNTTAKIGAPNQAIPPLCRGLKKLHLHYKRWLRGPERKALIPAFGDIVESKRHLKQTGFSLCLSFDGGTKEQVWVVRGLVEKFDIEMGDYYETWIGFSSPHGIVTLSTTVRHGDAYPQHFRELEYIAYCKRAYNLPIDYFLPFHSLKEVGFPSSTLRLQPNTPLSTNFPFFHTLRVLDVRSIHSSILAGQTFDKLERYRETGRQSEGNTGLLTEMPVCTRLVVGLSRLASLKLPQVRELSVFIEAEAPNGEEASSVWKTHVAVNSNLSGLKLLHLCNPFLFTNMQGTDLIQILGSLTALETLITDHGHIHTRYMDFFNTFLPIRAQETAGLHQSSGEGQISGVLCTKLESLQIEGISLTERPELIPILKDIISLRTTIGSPLKTFTFLASRYVSGIRTHRKWELIGKDGRFTMDKVVPAQPFELGI